MVELKYILFIVGTRSFMGTNQTIVKDCVELEEVVCNKDTVKKKGTCRNDLEEFSSLLQLVDTLSTGNLFTS